MIIRYIFNCYYWVAIYLCPSYISGLKHKNSDAISYRDDEEMLKQLEKKEYDKSYKYYMDHEEEQIIPLLKKSKTEIFATDIVLGL
jgi:hypothetical protein